jgi:hypothetical protein
VRLGYLFQFGACVSADAATFLIWAGVADFGSLSSLDAVDATDLPVFSLLATGFSQKRWWTGSEY